MREQEKKLNDKGFLGAVPAKPRSPLKDRFIFPPFSVWNTRDGFWQDRKRRWIKLGIESEKGREGVKTYHVSQLTYKKGCTDTSIFDPVCCELCYSWFCPEGGTIVDPFAGGSVRGIVASVMGYKYWGCDLSEEQIESNRQQLNENTTGKFKPEWIIGDSNKELKNAPKCDMVYSCPPYSYLEKYSNHPDDISNMSYVDFKKRYFEIIEKACDKLKQNRFACFIVSNIRNKQTWTMRDFVGDTIRGFKAAGLEFYNDVVIINPAGSASIRAENHFVRGRRKLVKLHQNALIFVKGEPEFDKD